MTGRRMVNSVTVPLCGMLLVKHPRNLLRPNAMQLLRLLALVCIGTAGRPVDSVMKLLLVLGVCVVLQINESIPGLFLVLSIMALVQERLISIAGLLRRPSVCRPVVTR